MHPTPTTVQDAPHTWTPPESGACIQYAEPEDMSQPLDKNGVTCLQQIIGTFLFYARAMDNTLLVAAVQTKGIAKTMDATIQLFNYAATNPDAAIRYHWSNMTLYAHSDASYLSKLQARSRVGGYFYLGNIHKAANNPPPNGPIHVGSRILKNIMAAAPEAEIGAFFHNGQGAAHI